MWIYDGSISFASSEFVSFWNNSKADLYRFESQIAERKKRGIYFLRVNWMRAVALEHDRDMYAYVSF